MNPLHHPGVRRGDVAEAAAFRGFRKAWGWGMRESGLQKEPLFRNIEFEADAGYRPANLLPPRPNPFGTREETLRNLR